MVSKTFSGDLLLDECHSHFMEDVFDETCPELTTVSETTTEESKAGVPTSAQRRTFNTWIFRNERFPTDRILGYGYGFLAVFIISVLSLAGLAAVPCINKAAFQYVLAFFTALAVGTLFGDAMFHLIPFVSDETFDRSPRFSPSRLLAYTAMKRKKQRRITIMHPNAKLIHTIIHRCMFPCISGAHLLQ